MKSLPWRVCFVVSAIFMGIGVTACALMVFIGEGDIMLASVLFFVGNIGVSGSTVFYDSLLPHVAKAGETDRVSSAGGVARRTVARTNVPRGVARLQVASAALGVWTAGVTAC